MENHEDHKDDREDLAEQETHDEAPELPPVVSAAPEHAPPEHVPPPPSPPLSEKNPALAGILSFLVPGLGQIYVGLTWRGAAFFLIEVAIFGFAVTNQREEELAFLLPTLFFIWLFAIFDAYRQATLSNYGFHSEAAMAPEPVSGLLPGIILVLIGIYGALRKYFEVDLSWIFSHWPIYLLLFGAWLIFRTLRERGEKTAV